MASRAVTLISALLVCFVPRAATAQDSLSVEVFALGSSVHDTLVSSGDSLSGASRASLLRALSPLQAACRSGALSKREEPGQASLSWRTLARVPADSCTWFFGALSCEDSLCGERVSHDRLAALCVGRRRSVVSLFPGDRSSIGEASVTRVDSVVVFRGEDHRLVEAWRKVTTNHPCWGGPDNAEAEIACFLVLRGDRVAQAFQIVANADTVSGDAVDGDQGTSVRSFFQIWAGGIEVRRRIEDWANKPNGDAARSKMREESIQLSYDPKRGRFF